MSNDAPYPGKRFHSISMLSRDQIPLSCIFQIQQVLFYPGHMLVEKEGERKRKASGPEKGVVSEGSSGEGASQATVEATQPSQRVYL